MQPEFWLTRWQQQQIGFHLATPNPHLCQFLPKLGLAPHSRLFVPLCGKSVDMAWCIAQGYRVVGVELSSLAIEAWFAEAGLTPSIQLLNGMPCWQAAQIEIWQGDIFQLTAAMLGQVDAIYDRAALIALPPAMRQAYSQHLQQLAPQVPQLLVTLAYEESSHAGPPFSVRPAEVAEHYASAYRLECVFTLEMANGLKGRFPAQESVWHCVPRAVLECEALNQ